MLSIQATILAIIYIIVIILMIIAAIMDAVKTRKAGITTPSWVIFTQVIAFFIWIAMIALLIYDTDCLTTGNCNIWSWIRTVLYAILPVLGIVLTIIGFRQISSQDTQMQDTQMQMQYMPVYSENK
jgi:hypothetical protein